MVGGYLVANDPGVTVSHLVIKWKQPWRQRVHNAEIAGALLFYRSSYNLSKSEQNPSLRLLDERKQINPLPVFTSMGL